MNVTGSVDVAGPTRWANAPSGMLRADSVPATQRTCPDIVPVARPRLTMAGMLDIDALTSGNPIRVRVFSISSAITPPISV